VEDEPNATPAPSQDNRETCELREEFES